MERLDKGLHQKPVPLASARLVNVNAQSLHLLFAGNQFYFFLVCLSYVNDSKREEW